MSETDRELLQYIVAKLVRIDAVLTTHHNMLVKDLEPSPPELAAARQQALRNFCHQNAEAELENLAVQFPDDIAAIREYLELADREILDAATRRLKKAGESSSDSDRDTLPPAD